MTDQARDLIKKVADGGDPIEAVKPIKEARRQGDSSRELIKTLNSCAGNLRNASSFLQTMIKKIQGMQRRGFDDPSAGSERGPYELQGIDSSKEELAGLVGGKLFDACWDNLDDAMADVEMVLDDIGEFV